MSSNDQDTAEAIDKYMQLLTKDGNNNTTSSPSYSYIRTIVLKALSDPKVFAGFAELRQVIESFPSSSSSEEGGDGSSGKAAILNTLSLFSYGTYQDYVTTTTTNTNNTNITNNNEESKEGGGMMNGYLSLNEGQLMKLKALTVMTVVKTHSSHYSPNTTTNNDTTINTAASTAPPSARQNRRNRRKTNDTNNTNMESTEPTKTPTPSTTTSSSSSPKQVPYSLLQSHLNLPQNEIRSLEEILLYCIQSNLLPPGTKLDQRSLSLILNLTSSSDTSSTIIRDVPVQDITKMISTLQVFQDQANTVKVTLEGSSKLLRDGMVNGATSWFIVDERISECKEEYKSLIKDTKSNTASGTSAVGGAGGGSGAGGPLGGVDWTATGSEDFMGAGSGSGEPVFYDTASSGRQMKRSKNRGSQSRGYGRH